MGICAGLKSNDSFVSKDEYLLQDSNEIYLSVLSVPDKRKVIINNVVYRAMVNLDLAKLNLKEGE